MMNIETINNYVRFFRDQKREVEKAYSYILDSSVKALLRDGALSLGTVVAAFPKMGQITLKIRKGFAPRLKMMKSFAIVTKQAREVYGQDITSWEASFRQFHDVKGMRMGESDILPLYFKKGTDATNDYVVCGSIEVEMFNFINDCINKMHKQLTVLLYDTYPPTEYFDNLAYFTHTHPNCKELHLCPPLNYDDWHPEELAYSPQSPDIVSDTVAKTLEKDGTCLLQGPPGTGKSYAIASVVSSYLKNGKNVCVATMANSGVIELVKQKPLSDELAAGKIYKTSLKADEAKSAVGLNAAKSDLVVPEGSLLCTTYYKLSSLVGANTNGNNHEGRFDLMVIEEASQAFLSTIVAFQSLGKRFLIVGDPMQLPPIVQGAQKPEYILWRVDLQCNGMMVYALGTPIKSYRIVTTFRLTQKSAQLTKLFYSENFHSVKRKFVDFSGLDKRYFPDEGGVLYKFIDGFVDQNYNEKSLDFIKGILQAIENNRPESSLAIISPFKETVRKLQSELQNDRRRLKDFTVETIDRIQGITVDYAILYLPAGGTSFALDTRRFNVATSRSLSTTLIISDVKLDRLASFKGIIRLFIEASKAID